MSIKIVVASHGNFAKELLNVSKMLMGESENIDVFGLQEGDSMQDYLSDIQNVVKDANTQNPVLILVDLYGGTPFNVCNALSTQNENIKVIYGANVPVLIEALTQRDEMEIEELVSYLEGIFPSALGLMKNGGMKK